MVKAQHKGRFAIYPVLDPIAAADLPLGDVQFYIGVNRSRSTEKMDDVLHVDQHLRGSPLIKAIAVESNRAAGGQFDPHAQSRQRNRIISWRGAFRGLVIEARKIVRCGAPRAPVGGLQQHIAKLANACARNMGVGKADDFWRAILIAAGIVPAGIGIIWPWRDHGEGRRSAWEGVACAIGANERVDIARHGDWRAGGGTWLCETKKP